MTKNEHKVLSELLDGDRNTLHTRLASYLDTAEIREYEDTRSSQQNRALHLWFQLVAETCRDAGYDAKLVMNNTVSVEMNADIVKGMWKVMQEALYGTKSTTELQKKEQIDNIVNHFIRFFGERFGLELPPFPTKELQSIVYAGNTKVPYPTDYQKPKIWNKTE